MSGRPVLVGMAYSVWTEAARWALEERGVPYRFRDHVPFLGEPLLRRAARRAGGVKPTTPYVDTGDEVVVGSLAIARWADGQPGGAALAPGGWDEVTRIDALAERVRNAGRALFVRRLLASDAALDESHPPQIPRPLRPLLRPVARRAATFVATKYGVLDGDDAEGLRELTDALDALERARGGRETFLDAPSYADLSAATSVQTFAPVADRHLPLGPASRAAWAREALHGRYGALLAWRDRVYDARRRGVTGTR